MRSWNLNADNLEEMVAFYRELGAEESNRQTIGGAAVARLRLGAHGIGLFDASAGPRPGIPHHTFTCEGPADPDELSKELADHGIEVESVRREGEGPRYSVYVTDPSGNRLELSVTPA
jgi:catechol 2,3-dioxygenase-like lactoylglutathione lyase family enzyme